jgi:hypothetical protein
MGCTAMITSWKGALSVERGLFADGTDSTNPVLIYNLVVIPDSLLLLVCFL